MRTTALVICAALLACGPLAAHAATTASPQYIIHPNDQLNVQVFGDPTLSQTVAVLPSGDINYPLVGSIHVAGETPTQASATVAKALKKYVRDPHVVVLVQSQGKADVLVLGGVQHPGKVELTSSGTFTDAVAAAGGLAAGAQLYGDATVTDYAGGTQKVSLEKIYSEGDLSGNVGVPDGSTIFIPAPATIDVEVSGAVDHPGEIELNQGDRLSMAIAKAGDSPTSDGDLNNIHVTRLANGGQSQSFNVDLYQELQQGNVSKDIILQKGDVVYVPKNKHGLVSQSGSASSNPLYLLLIGARLLFPNI
ncbi:MAG TPA: polysaccharide biosynthesis/export family protein [Candidatus Eremiobacteraceae bacterium]|jgi:polysaccharide export outer membrane protein